MQKNTAARLMKFDLDHIAGRSWLVGIDEAGRGALAGPVCAGAVAVSDKLYKSPKCAELLDGLNDSKQLSEAAREALYGRLESLRERGFVDFEAGFADVGEIESLNILAATQLAMRRACEAVNARLNLALRPAGGAATLFGENFADISLAEVLIDGKPMKKFPFAHRAVVKGDASSLAVAAASIVAKVSRDRFMKTLAASYPRYGFDVHKGYGTAAHLQALMLYGASSAHRPSFLKNMRANAIPGGRQTELF